MFYQTDVGTTTGTTVSILGVKLNLEAYFYWPLAQLIGGSFELRTHIYILLYQFN